MAQFPILLCQLTRVLRNLANVPARTSGFKVVSSCITVNKTTNIIQTFEQNHNTIESLTFTFQMLHFANYSVKLLRIYNFTILL